MFDEILALTNFQVGWADSGQLICFKLSKLLKYVRLKQVEKLTLHWMIAESQNNVKNLGWCESLQRINVIEQESMLDIL